MPAAKKGAKSISGPPPAQTIGDALSPEIVEQLQSTYRPTWKTSAGHHFMDEMDDNFLQKAFFHANKRERDHKDEQTRHLHAVQLFATKKRELLEEFKRRGQEPPTIPS